MRSVSSEILSDQPGYSIYILSKGRPVSHDFGITTDYRHGGEDILAQ